MPDSLTDPARLAAVARARQSVPQGDDLDHLTALARRLLRTPVALISLVTDDRQVFPSALGLPEPWRSRGGTPLTHSFCQHAVRTAEPLIVSDARVDALLRDNLAVEELGVVAYAGVPLIDQDGHALGALCAIDSKPRAWTPDEIDILSLLRTAVVSRIGLAEQKADAQSHAVAAEQALRALAVRERYFHALTDHALDLVTVLGGDATIHYESASIAPVLGYGASDLVGRNAFEYVHPEDRAHVEAHFRRLVADATQHVEVEFRFRHADGSYRLLAGKGVNLLDEPVVAGIVFNSSDVTARRQAEERLRLAQKTETMAQLAAGIVHDLNNALAIIVGNVELIAVSAGTLNDADRAGLEDVRAAARSAADLTARLLAAGRHAPIQQRAMPIAPVVDRVARLVARALPRGVVLAADVPPVPDVWGDPGAIEQVLLNLIANARDAMPSGGTIRLRAAVEPVSAGMRAEHPWATADAYAVVRVIDDGTGIDGATLPHIFDPFFTTKAEGKGTGLGLAMVSGIATQLGGGVTVASTPGTGTTVSVYLQLAG